MSQDGAAGVVAPERALRSRATEHAATVRRLASEHAAKSAKEKSARTATIRKDAVAGLALQKIHEVRRSGTCADPASCVPVCEMPLPYDKREQARRSWHDCCLVCGSSEAVAATGTTGGLNDASDHARRALAYAGPAQGQLLFCVDCGEAVHACCASAPIELMSDVAKATWRCPNCKVCELCGLCTHQDEARLLYCDLCDKGYHLECVRPALEAAHARRLSTAVYIENSVGVLRMGETSLGGLCVTIESGSGEPQDTRFIVVGTLQSPNRT